MKFLSIGMLAALSSPALASPGLTLKDGAVNATLTVEDEASAGHFGDSVSLAPDLAVGLSDDLTVALIHSSFGRTGSRAGVADGLCTTSACAHTYDNAGIEALYGLRGGAFAIAVDGGFYGTSFDRGDYAAKLGAKFRYKLDRVTFQFLPSISLALTNRDAMVVNHDRFFLPASVTVGVGAGVAVGVAALAKAPLDAAEKSFEGGPGACVIYTASPAVGFGASWTFVRMFGGSVAMDSPHGIDQRTIQLWMTVTE